MAIYGHAIIKLVCSVPCFLLFFPHFFFTSSQHANGMMHCHAVVNEATATTGVIPPIMPHRVCCLALCGIHLGPLMYLQQSTLLQPYLHWFESAAARELFEFQVSAKMG